MHNPPFQVAGLFQPCLFQYCLLHSLFQVFGVIRNDYRSFGFSVGHFNVRTVLADNHETVFLEKFYHLLRTHWHVIYLLSLSCLYYTTYFYVLQVLFTYFYVSKTHLIIKVRFYERKSI